MFLSAVIVTWSIVCQIKCMKLVRNEVDLLVSGHLHPQVVLTQQIYLPLFNKEDTWKACLAVRLCILTQTGVGRPCGSLKCGNSKTC